MIELDFGTKYAVNFTDDGGLASVVIPDTTDVDTYHIASQVKQHLTFDGIFSVVTHYGIYSVRSNVVDVWEFTVSDGNGGYKVIATTGELSPFKAAQKCVHAALSGRYYGPGGK